MQKNGLNYRLIILKLITLKTKIMIFELKFTERTEFAQAKNLKKLQEDYAQEYGEEEILEIKSITIITADNASLCSGA